MTRWESDPGGGPDEPLPVDPTKDDGHGSATLDSDEGMEALTYEKVERERESFDQPAPGYGDTRDGRQL